MDKEFGLATRGSGEGFHSEQAKLARAQMHESNRVNNFLSRTNHERAWSRRFEMPTLANSSLQLDVDAAHAVDSARFQGDPRAFLEAQQKAFASSAVVFEA